MAGFVATKKEMLMTGVKFTHTRSFLREACLCVVGICLGAFLSVCLAQDKKRMREGGK